MKATVLVDNIPGEGLGCEWGLSIYIEYGDKNILLDTGESAMFLENAEKLGMDIKKIHCAVLSHAHFDHSGGMDYFFEACPEAKFYVRKGCSDNCYKKEGETMRYLGPPREILKRFNSRLVYAQGDYELMPGGYLIPHKLPGRAELGKREQMYIKNGLDWEYDDFTHEQSLVFETENGLVIFSSCSHGGADNILREIAETFPDKNICALVGGFHTFNKTEEEVRAFAGRVKATGIKTIYTGHCTGEDQYKILQEELGDVVNHLQGGLVMEF